MSLGISILMQEGNISMGIMLGKIYLVHTVLFNQSENFLNSPHYVHFFKSHIFLG